MATDLAEFTELEELAIDMIVYLVREGRGDEVKEILREDAD